jgi:hypothetical protein
MNKRRKGAKKIKKIVSLILSSFPSLLLFSFLKNCNFVSLSLAGIVFVSPSSTL